MLSIVTPSIVHVFITRPVVIDQTIQKKYSRPHHGRQRRQWLIIIHKCRHMEPSDLVSRYSIRFFCQEYHPCTSAIISFAQSAPMFNWKGQPVIGAECTQTTCYGPGLKGPWTVVQLKVVFTTYLIQQEDYSQYFWKGPTYILVFPSPPSPSP